MAQSAPSDSGKRSAYRQWTAQRSTRPTGMYQRKAADPSIWKAGEAAARSAPHQASRPAPTNRPLYQARQATRASAPPSSVYSMFTRRPKQNKQTPR